MNQVLAGSPLLSARNIVVSYRSAEVLHGVSLNVWPRQIIAVVGPNGAGKSTLFKAIAGVFPIKEGGIVFKGEEISSLPLWERVGRGLVYVPEGMSVFPDMTVVENLEVGAYLQRNGTDLRMRRVFELFPELGAKKNALAGVLSGGEKRMVTLGRGLMSGAEFLLLDDPFLGLSPKIINRFCDAFRSLRRQGSTLLIAGQHVRRILNVAEIAMLIERGKITLAGSGVDMLKDRHLQQILFGISGEGHPTV